MILSTLTSKSHLTQWDLLLRKNSVCWASNIVCLYHWTGTLGIKWRTLKLRPVLHTFMTNDVEHCIILHFLCCGIFFLPRSIFLHRCKASFPDCTNLSKQLISTRPIFFKKNLTKAPDRSLKCIMSGNNVADSVN